jgi:hypothetical protein
MLKTCYFSQLSHFRDVYLCDKCLSEKESRKRIQKMNKTKIPLKKETKIFLANDMWEEDSDYWRGILEELGLSKETETITLTVTAAEINELGD